MEPEDPLLCSQEPANFLFPQPDRSTCLVSFKFILTLSSHLHLSLSRFLFPSRFSIKILCVDFSSPLCLSSYIIIIIIIIIYLSWSWTTCWPVPVSRIRKSLQRSTMIPSANLDSSISLPWVIYFEAFYLHVVSSFPCIPVICPKLVLFVITLQFVHLFCNLSKCILLFFSCISSLLLLFLHKIKYDWYFCHHYSGPSLINLILGF